MKGIAFYCDKTIAQRKRNIKETETDLKSVTANKYRNIQIEETIKSNEAKAKPLIHQIRKCKNLTP